MSTDYHNKILQITYKGKLICSGRISSEKNVFHYDNQCSLVSVDNKHFINLNHPDISIIELSKPVRTYLNLDGVRITLFSDMFKHPKEVVYREWDTSELDKEIIPLVDALNKINNVMTTGSCSGHGREVPWVNFFCNDFHTLIKLSNIVCNHPEAPFGKEWAITTRYNLWNGYEDKIQLTLICNLKGAKAYKSIDRLACYLEMVANNLG